MTTNDGSRDQKKLKKECSQRVWKKLYWDMVDLKTSTGQTIHAYARDALNINHLREDYSENCILHEVFLRRPEQNHEIKDLYEWIKSELLLVIWEKLFLATIDPKTSTGQTIFASVRTELNRYHLGEDYSEHYILHEVFLRGRNQHGEIRDLHLWIRGASRLVIKELSRKDSRFISLAFDPCSPDIDDNDLEEYFAYVRQALAQLSVVDERLLSLKVVENLSWTEIRDTMRVEGYGDAPEATWRKRKERALTRLRRLYHEIKKPF